MTVGEHIKKLRATLKLSQQEFAKRIHISQVSVSKIESGKNEPDERTLRVIEEEFGVNRAWLKSGSGEMFVMPEQKTHIEIDATPESIVQTVKTINRAFDNADAWRKESEMWRAESETWKNLYLSLTTAGAAGKKG
jgi:transcriptional regulator with XRE-family HTH domain